MTPYDHAPPVSPQSGEPGSHPPPNPKRSGSQKRKRDRSWRIALDEQEETAALDGAAKAELSKMAYGRAMLLGSPGPRARRKPPVHAEALGDAAVAVNKLGVLFNQIAHALNAIALAPASGAGLAAALSLAQKYLDELEDVRLTLRAIREAAGYRDRGEGHDDNQTEPA